MELTGNIKNYQWGKKGSESAVAELAKSNSPNFVINENENYAELWMGSHVSGPSSVKSTGEDLQTYLSKQGKDTIGGHDTLPFLFKVLSVQQALSIQVHPNKEEAARLHLERPDVYKDPNHKPEMAIALTPFLAMCGFRPYNEILSFCRKLPPLMELLGKNNAESLSQGLQGLRVCFQDLMTADEESVKTCIKEIYENYTDILKAADLYEIFQQINTDFPNDVGILCLFFLNVLRLQPGEAIFLGANEIHAYLQGDCVECMACSDNVVRAGLTPKYKDVDTLLRNISYEAAPASQKSFQPTSSDSNYKLFSPNIEDFAVAQITIPKDQEKYSMKNESYGSILLVLEGERTLKAGNLPEIKLHKGSIVFIPGNCGERIEFSSLGDGSNFVGYLSMYNSFLEKF